MHSATYDKAVSVESPSQATAIPPTSFIGSRQARLLTSAAASVEQDIVEGSSVQIHAIAGDGCSLMDWSDEDTNETRTVTIAEV